MSFGLGVFLLSKVLMAQKTFTTYGEQINLLKQRGIAIKSQIDKDFATEVLQKIGYYGLINGYKKPFIDIMQSDDNTVSI